MLKFENIEIPLPFSDSVSITVGNFDGVHLAHHALIMKMQKLSKHPVALTFCNHPKEILAGQKKERILFPQHRDLILERSGLAALYSLPFTKEFASLTPEKFLTKLKSTTSFDHLVLGYDAVLGNQRSGTPECLYKLSKTLDFKLHYIEPITQDSAPISSSRIRGHIKAGELEIVKQMLGRPYSIFGIVEKGAQRGRLLGFQTANINVKGLALPPFGVYVVQTMIEGQTIYGVANLGTAPTFNADRLPILEVHLFDYEASLYGKALEIHLLNYLRSEKKFTDPHTLKTQIKKDIEQSKNYVK